MGTRVHKISYSMVVLYIGIMKVLEILARNYHTKTSLILIDLILILIFNSCIQLNAVLPHQQIIIHTITAQQTYIHTLYKQEKLIQKYTHAKHTNHNYTKCDHINGRRKQL